MRILLSVKNTLCASLFVTCLFSPLSMVVAAPIQEYLYEPNKIYPVWAGMGIATQIEIDPQEQIKDYGTGFSNAWDLVRRENIFYLKPKAEDADTNLYIRTEKRVYLMELKVASKDWKTLEEAKTAGVQYHVKFTYPKDASAEDKPASTKVSQKQGNEVVDPFVTPDVKGQNNQISGYSNYYYAYEYAAESDSKWLVPTKVYDDGNFIYVHIPSTASYPAIYGAKPGETESLLNTTVEGNVVIVHGIYPTLTLRHGTSVVGLRRK